MSVVKHFESADPTNMAFATARVRDDNILTELAAGHLRRVQCERRAVYFPSESLVKKSTQAYFYFSV